MEAKALDWVGEGTGRGEAGVITMMMCSGSRSRERVLVLGQVGRRSVGTDDPGRMDWRYGVRMGVTEGGLFQVIKKLLKEGLAGAIIRWSLCCFPWSLQWQLGDRCSAEAH